MKTTLAKICTVIMMLGPAFVFAQAVIISDDPNYTVPDPSSVLDIKSTAKGMVIPRLTMAERDVIGSPAVGLMIYQTDNTPGFYFNAGSAETPDWQLVGYNSGQWNTSGNDIYNKNMGYVGIGTTTPGAKLEVSGDDILINGLTIGKGLNFVNNNSAFGVGALSSNLNGQGNTAIGYYSLRINSTGDGNTAVGNNTLAVNTEGYNNTAIGYQALNRNTTGGMNTAVGTYAMIWNSEGFANTACGEAALYDNTTGHNNVANGAHALSSNTEGFYNSAIGSLSLYLNKTGYHNTAAGQSALHMNISGNSNTAIGVSSLYSNNTGQNNTALGKYSGYNYDLHLSGQDNTFLGANTTYSDSSITNSTAVGANVELVESNTIILGNNARVGIGTSTPVTSLDVVGMMRLTPSGIPCPCDAELEGGIYYDILLSEICFCDGQQWMQMDGGGPCQCQDTDMDGYDTCDPSNSADTDGNPADCDDSDPDVHPGAIEICNGVDDDCDQEIDNDAYCPSYPHMYSSCDASSGTCIYSCEPGWVECNGNIEDGCEYLIPAWIYEDADGDGWGVDSTAMPASGCLPLGWSEQFGDCDDADPDINPGEAEICGDTLDNDCDGLTDAEDPDCN